MRYCTECGDIYTTQGNVCTKCNAKTEDLGISDAQQQLFDATEVDNIKSVYRQLTANLNLAAADVNKAEATLRKRIAERETAANTLLIYDKVIKARGNTGEDPPEVETVTDEAYLLPEAELEQAFVEDYLDDDPGDETPVYDIPVDWEDALFNEATGGLGDE